MNGRYVWRDEFERELWNGVARFAFAGQRRQAENLAHLAKGYAAGIEQDEVLARIEAGELERTVTL